MNYKEAIFFVLSGTGNTYRVACWMAEKFEENGGKADVTMIDNADPRDLIDESTDRLVGLLFPTHGFMAPWSMIKFFFRMPRQRGVPAICAATRGSFKIGPVYVPGAAGWGTFMAALILFIKGYDIRGMFSLDMPANMTNLHWGLHRKNICAISNKARKKLDFFMDPILAGKRIWFTLNNLWEMAWTIGILWLIPIMPILYLLLGRIYMGKLHFSNNNCIGCGLCAKACPNEGIVMRKVGNKKRPFWTYHCEACLRCMGYCRRQAVEAGHSWAVILYYITAIPVTVWMLTWLHETIPYFPVIEGYWTQALISLIYVFPAMILSYFIFWWLLRIPFINTVFRYTTFTRWYRRFHEPDTKLKNMTVGRWKSEKGSSVEKLEI